MLPDWLKDFLIQLPSAASWNQPIAEFVESVRDSFETSPHLAHREFSLLIDGLLVAHLIELEISAEDFDGLSHEIANSADVRLKPLRQYLEAGGDFQVFASLMAVEIPRLPPKVPGTPPSNISLVTSVALDPLSQAPSLPALAVSAKLSKRSPSGSELPAIPEYKPAAIIAHPVLPSEVTKKALTTEEISRRLERLQNLKLHIAKTTSCSGRQSSPPTLHPSGSSSNTSRVVTEEDQARQLLTLNLLQDLKLQ